MDTKTLPGITFATAQKALKICVVEIKENVKNVKETIFVVENHFNLQCPAMWSWCPTYLFLYIHRSV